MNLAHITPQQRGREFEDHVADLLEQLRSIHPAAVEISRHPKLVLHNGAEVIPDFELIYHLPFQVSRVLIECQDRTRGSQEIARKISYIKSHSPHNRAIFIHNDPSLLSKALGDALEADGVLHYDSVEFAAMLFHLSTTMEAAKLAYSGFNEHFPCLLNLSELKRQLEEAREYAASWFNRAEDDESQQRLPPKSESLEESQKRIFLPRSVEFLRRIFRNARKRRCLGPTFADEVIVEIFNGQCKEEVGRGSVCAYVRPIGVSACAA